MTTTLFFHTAVEGKFEIYRNGNLVREVAHDAVYNYHKSPIHYHEPPVEVKPGIDIAYGNI